MKDTKVILVGVRFSYVHVFKPHAFKPTDEPKYRLTVLIDKDDDENLDKVEDAIEAAAAASKKPLGKKWDSPLRDGDDEKPEDENFANSFFLGASSNRKPNVVDANLDPIMDEDDFYSGCIGNVSLNFSAYNNEGKGVGCYLENVMKTDDGERIGAKKATAEEDFSAFASKKKRSASRDDKPSRRSSSREEEEEDDRPARRGRRGEEEEEPAPRRRR